MKISREVKAAVLVISGILLFIYLFNFLKGENIFADEVEFYTEFEYNALNMSSPVTIKGNQIGKIEKIKYDFESGKTRVEFSVDPKLKFSKSSVIRLYETGLMGGNGLAIIDSNEGPIAQKGDFIQSEVEKGLISSLSGNFSEISTDLDKTIRSADTLLLSLTSVVNDASPEGLKATISELNRTLKSFKNLSYSINDVVKQNDEKIAATLESIQKASENFSALSEDLKKAELSKAVASFDETLQKFNSVLSGLEQGQGSMGKLLKDDKLYNNLEAVSKEMELLILDIKLHPARYRRILSKREIPYEPPTEEQINEKN
ncbi:MlaD family protein [Winogradskyella litorisediminis]|uniref:MlaD family protein n=1 Tax=Winogradskyella litorisediminis TaxID=1156618 RepID=A0ABW3N5Z7_9FLAO